MKFFAAAASAAAIVFTVWTGAAAGDVAKSDASAAYAALKTFAGQWTAAVSTEPKTNMDGLKMALKIRVTSSGNAIVHEMGAAAAQDGPEKMGDITVFYLEGDAVLATHYCDADTRSRFKAVPSSDPTTLVFDLVDVTGKTQQGYVSKITFKSDTPDHHNEELWFVMPDKTVLHAKFDLRK
jgi:hypothetical protein